MENSDSGTLKFSNPVSTEKEETNSLREAADKWVTNNPDGEVRRMYGHYVRAFMAGGEWQRDQLLKENQELKEQNEGLKVDVRRGGNNWAQLVAENAELKDRIDSLNDYHTDELRSLQAINAELLEALTKINIMCADASTTDGVKINVGDVSKISISAINKAKS